MYPAELYRILIENPAPGANRPGLWIPLNRSGYMTRLPDDLRMKDLIAQIDAVDPTGSKDAQFDAMDEIGRRWLQSIGVDPQDWMLDFVQSEGPYYWQSARRDFELSRDDAARTAEIEFLTRYLYRNPLEVFLSGEHSRFSQGVDTVVAAYHLSRWASDWSRQRYQYLSGSISDALRGEMHNMALRLWNPTGWELILPIGKESISSKVTSEAADGEFSDQAMSAMPDRWAVTEGNTWAAFVVPVRVGRTGLAAFPLVVESPDQTPEQRHTQGIAYRLTGEVHIHLVGDPLSPDVVSCIDGIQKWSRRFAGQRVGGGMPPFISNRDQLIAAHAAFVNRMGRNPTQSELAAEFGTQERTLRRALDRFGIRWQDL